GNVRARRRLVFLELRDPGVRPVPGALRLPEDLPAALSARGVDALQHVRAADPGPDRLDPVGAEGLAEDVLDLALLRLAEEPGAGLLGRLLQLPDLALHLLDLELLLAQLELMLLRGALSGLERDLLALLVEAPRQL